MTRILLLTAILVAALSISAFAATDEASSNLTLTVNSYIDITSGGDASGSVTGTNYDNGYIILTNSGSGNVNVKANDTYGVKAKISTGGFGTAGLYLKFDTGSFILLSGTDTNIVTGQTVTNSRDYAQTFRVGSGANDAQRLTPEGTPYNANPYTATVVMTAFTTN